MHLSLALFRQRATAAALYPLLVQLMHTLGLTRLSYGVTVEKAYANGERYVDGKGIRRNALEAGLADGTIVSFHMAKGLMLNEADIAVAYVNDARHDADVQVHLPLKLLGLSKHGTPPANASAAQTERTQAVLNMLNELVQLAQPECGWQMVTPGAADGLLHAQGASTLLPNELICDSDFWAQQPWTQPRMLFPLNWLSPTMLAALPAPDVSTQAPLQDEHSQATLGQRLQALLGEDALQPISPTLTRVAVPEAQLNAINDTLGREGRLACRIAPRVRKSAQ